jgi:hypothetical protein
MIATVLAVPGSVNASPDNSGTPGRVVFDSSFIKVYKPDLNYHVPGHDQYIRNVADWLERGSAVGTDILIYNTYYSAGYPKTYFSPGADTVLNAYGCTVTMIDRISGTTITSTLLANYDQLWVINGQKNSPGLFTSTEIQAILDFNEQGNGLMIISDHDDRPVGTDIQWSADVDQIAANFGVEFDHFIDLLGIHTVEAPDFDVSHPIWVGVSSVWCGTDAEIITTNPEVQVIASPGDKPTVAVIDPPVPIQATIDIKPGSDPNSINLGSNGVIPVAILSSSVFDANQVDPVTVSLGGAGVAVKGKGNNLMSSLEDVNEDGLIDLLIKVETENLDPGEIQDGWIELYGELYDGTLIEGKDTVNIVPP